MISMKDGLDTKYVTIYKEEMSAVDVSNRQNIKNCSSLHNSL